MRTLAGVLFIAAMAALAVFLWTKETHADGRRIAALMLAQDRAKGITSVECDPDLLIGMDGAVFQCHLKADDGSTATLEVTLDRVGMYKPGKVLASTPGTHPARTGGDPWK